MNKLDIIFISGASNGIGESISKNALHYSKYIVPISSSNSIKNKIFYNERYMPLQININDHISIEKELLKVDTFSLKNLNIGVVLCASQIGEPGGIFNSDLNNWIDLFKINTIGNIALLKYILKNINNINRLRVVFFAGGGAAYAYPLFSGYSLSKVATVRAVENIGLEFRNNGIKNSSIIALAPGAVDTKMLKKVILHGGDVRTKTSIDEPVKFVEKFMIDQINSFELNGRFLHVRDKLDLFNSLDGISEKFFLRRVE